MKQKFTELIIDFYQNIRKMDSCLDMSQKCPC